MVSSGEIQAPRALLRAVPDSLARSLTRVESRESIDVGRARSQHQAYAGALRSAGYATEVLAADEKYPDCCFIEDAAVVVGEVVVLTRSGAPSRRGEVEKVANALHGRMALERLQPPAMLDGGDVLQVGGRFYVGRSERTNREGIRQFTEVAARQGMEVVPVEVGDVLHLKSAVTALDGESVLLAPGLVEEAPFASLRAVRVPPEEWSAANALRLPDRVLVAAGHPRALALIEEAGFATVPIDIDQFQRADAGLTCLSVLLD